jgi:hypothetical protein
MNVLDQKISDVFAAEQKLSEQVRELIGDIISNLRSQKMEGVAPIQGTLQCAVVNFSTIAKHKNNLSPTYYISDYQIAAIKEKLTSMVTLKQLYNFLHDALENGYVVCKNEKIILNPAIKTRLEEIYNIF